MIACGGCLVGHLKTAEAKINANTFDMAMSVEQANQVLAKFNYAEADLVAV